MQAAWKMPERATTSGLSPRDLEGKVWGCVTAFVQREQKLEMLTADCPFVHNRDDAMSENQTFIQR